MYFFDTGLAAYLSGIDTAGTLQRSFLKGRFFETFTMNEIRKSYRNEGVDVEMFYYRDNKQNEIDLIFIRDGEIHLAEMKSGTHFSAGDVSAFKQLSGTQYIKGKNAIICTADKYSVLSDGTLIVPVASI